MFPEVARIARQGFKRVNVPFPTNEHAGEKRVEAHICSHVVNNVFRLDRFLKLPLFVMFITSQPAAVIGRPYDPLLAAQRALNNGHNRTSGNQTQRGTEPLAYQSLVRNTGKISQ